MLVTNLIHKTFKIIRARVYSYLTLLSFSRMQKRHWNVDLVIFIHSVEDFTTTSEPVQLKTSKVTNKIETLKVSFVYLTSAHRSVESLQLQLGDVINSSGRNLGCWPRHDQSMLEEYSQDIEYVSIPRQLALTLEIFCILTFGFELAGFIHHVSLNVAKHTHATTTGLFYSQDTLCQA